MDTEMADTSALSSHYGQVQVHFTTNSPDIELPEGKRQLLVPTNVRRYGLSQILNSESMLDTPAPIPFDFLINGTFLRTTLEEYLTANGLSSETTLSLQYVRSLIPPLFEASFEHDDWVSCVDVLSSSSLAGTWGANVNVPVVLGQERILSGSYDGLLRLWNKSGQAIATSSSSSAGGHTASIKSAKFISPTQIASSSLDRTIRIWKYSEADDHFSGELKPVLELYGHLGGIDSIDVHGPSNRILSASTDGSIGLWTTAKNSAPAADEALISGPNAKRRKLTTSTNTPQRGPLSLISSHTAPVSAAIFNPLDSTVAYSASQDHTVRTMAPAEFGTFEVRELARKMKETAWLERLKETTGRGRRNQSVRDGTCRVWDLRSSRTGTKDEGNGVVGEAVYVIERESQKGKKRPVGGEGIKVYGVAWDKEVGIVSASEDKMVQINRGRGVTRPNDP
ncbi:related to microtubule-interacting protein [Phialocephala subalpina]|uniref:Related to microtubule-interacting protein n=1 Tax=Phialocephala subalpina TaxID=576137 RepID=A0A1L7XR39_9HELO|nr:related to microtubule-interacting protein [Phialocephala subalpina]